ncbi:MAG TPA: ABC transporter substrate-binding protein [Actinomycetota bacterium]|nr:ABC transporter substrate-binding protein [Actinomycetota bacterium]
MRGSLKLLALSAVFVLVTAACGRGGDQPGQQGGAQVQRGGTLLVGLEEDVDAAFDPQKEYYSVTWGLFHCCLARTLLTTPTLPLEEGGNEMVPDLATEIPEPSEDGLVYTFTIKDGVRWGPPLEDREIVADDFINALERTADPKAQAGYAFYYSVIEGFDDFADGKADSISGLRAVDDKTLEITLTRPTPDFVWRMTLHATAPIPRGAEEGHEKDYGRFLVSSGPYMFEGSEDLNFDVPAEEQEPVSGYVPGRSIVLVRNPSWDPATDEIRPAYLDRMEFQIGLTTEDMQDKIAAGELDVNADGIPPPQVIQEYQTDPEREDQVVVVGATGTDFLSLNIAEPPLDDVNVRRAVSHAVDRAGLQQIEGGPLLGEPVSHVIPDPLLEGLLADYVPFGTPDGGPDVDAATEAMSQSEYDQDGDGQCDAPECQNVVTIVDDADPYPDQARLIAQNLEEIGITLDLQVLGRTPAYDKCGDPASHYAICTFTGWLSDYPDATTFGEPMFGSAAIGPASCCNYFLVGASPDLLREADYEVTDVPNVDDRAAECDALPLGDERVQCWAEFDRYLSEEVVPVVSLSTIQEVFVYSDRITRFRGDYFSTGPAFDQIALAGGTE